MKGGIVGSGLQGLLWSFVFVILDAVQAVFFGGVLQRQDAFLIGGLVFGLSATGCIAWTAIARPEQISIALRHPAPLAGLNLTAAGAWLAYFIAIQLTEPAVAFTIFVGVIPISTIIASYCGFPEAETSRNRIETLGNAILILGLLMLAGFTLFGQSGFVRGGTDVALLGLALAVAAGVLITLMLLYSKRLDGVGLEPVAQFGLRFPIFVVLAFAGFAMGVDDKGPVPPGDILHAVAIGMILLAFPIYAVQKAVSLTTPLTIASIAATAPLIVFLLQMVEGRVDYSNATSAGLVVYFIGAIVTALGSARASARQPARDALA